MHARSPTLGFLSLLPALGCAAIIEFPDDPELVTQPAPLKASEPPAGAGWQCLTDPPENVAPSAPLARVAVEACDALRGCSMPVTGLMARLCDKLDVDCTNPLRSGISDNAGVLEFNVPTADFGFDGYLEISAPSELCTSPSFGAASPLACSLVPQCNPQVPDASCMVPTYARTLLFFNPPIVGDLPQPVQLSLLSSVALPGMVRAAGAAFDPALGNLIVTTRNCDGLAAAGVSYEMGNGRDQGTKMYMDSGVLSKDRDATDATGLGAFAGVTPGFASVAAYNRAGLRVGGIGVQVAPSTITYASLLPSREPR